MQGSTLRRLRRALGLSQAAFGSKVAKDGSTISRYESGDVPIPRDFLLAMRGAGLILKQKKERA